MAYKRNFKDFGKFYQKEQEILKLQGVLEEEEREVVYEEFLSEEENIEYSNSGTSDFDLALEKKLPLSTAKSMLKEVDKCIALSKEPYEDRCLNFDKLKIAIDLISYKDIISFKYLPSSFWDLTNEPEKASNYVIDKENADRIIEQALSKSYEKEHAAQNKDCEFESVVEYADREAELHEFDVENEFQNTRGIFNFPNCRIDYKLKKQYVGINNIYIKNDMLIIYLSGKFMAKKGYYGGINKNNINECLDKVLGLHLFEFDKSKFIEHSWVYLVDTILDVEVEDKQKTIMAYSSLFPMATSNDIIYKYSTSGLFLRNKSKNSGSSLCIYDKAKEVKISNKKVRKDKWDLPRNKYQDIIGEEFNNNSKVIRFEARMWTLQDIRKLLEIPLKTPKIVNLIDVLNSKAKPIIMRFAKFGASEENLRKYIATYIEDEVNCQSAPKSEKVLLERLAYERILELFTENNYDINKVKAYICVENDIVAENLIKRLPTTLRNGFFNALVYKKPKTIRLVLKLLNLIEIAYGRKSKV